MRRKLTELMQDTRKIFRLYALGALLFFIGLGTIQGADHLLPPSLKQESYVLLGLVIGGMGFFIAITAQILLIVYRMKNMGKG